MTNPQSISPRAFGKYHQMNRLETTIRNCFCCNKQITYIYKGDFGNKLKHQYTYECMSCGSYFISLKKLK